MEKRKNDRALERRWHTGEVEIRSKGNTRVIEGHAAVFNKRSQNLGGFVEQVETSAFNKTLKEADVRALQNHDENRVLGRSKAGTLRLSTDDSGLYYEIDSPDTSYARDLEVLLERKDVDQSSFAFHAIDDEWDLTDDGFPLRSLRQVALVDVSVVTYPAYLDANSGVRTSALVGLAKRSGYQITDLSDVDAIKAAIEGRDKHDYSKDKKDEETCDCKAENLSPECEAAAKEGAARNAHTLKWTRRAQYAATLESVLRDE